MFIIDVFNIDDIDISILIHKLYNVNETLLNPPFPFTLNPHSQPHIQIIESTI